MAVVVRSHEDFRLEKRKLIPSLGHRDAAILEGLDVCVWYWDYADDRYFCSFVFSKTEKAIIGAINTKYVSASGVFLRHRQVDLFEDDAAGGLPVSG